MRDGTVRVFIVFSDDGAFGSDEPLRAVARREEKLVERNTGERDGEGRIRRISSGSAVPVAGAYGHPSVAGAVKSGGAAAAVVRLHIGAGEVVGRRVPNPSAFYAPHEQPTAAVNVARRGGSYEQGERQEHVRRRQPRRSTGRQREAHEASRC